MSAEYRGFLDDAVSDPFLLKPDADHERPMNQLPVQISLSGGEPRQHITPAMAP